MTSSAESPQKTMEELIRAGDAKKLRSFVVKAPQLEIIRAISRLHAEDQEHLFSMLDQREAMDIISSMPESAAVQVVEGLTPEQAGPIVENMRNDKNAGLLVQLKESEASAILETLPSEKAEEIRRFMTYPRDSAAGLMDSEFLSYPEHFLVKDALEDLRINGDRYSDYAVQYAYVVSSSSEKLVGVLRLRDLLMAPRNKRVTDVMIADPVKVTHDQMIGSLKRLFEENRFFGLPVVDAEGRMVGILRRASVEEQLNKQSNQIYLKISGIVGGEEFRTMPLKKRSFRRLSWLSLNIVLNMVAASIIAVYQDTLAQVIALAVFLPIISDMSGCSGNQAVAVSMRELTLGLVKPREILRVIFKESQVGIINGIVLGLLLAGVAVLWKGNAFLGLVVGSALALNTLLAVCLGGVIPLFLKWAKQDPALASGPILTTVTDMCGFFFVLSFATLVLRHLT